MNMTTWKDKVENFVQENAENIVRDIKRLINIPSVEEPATDNAPFGKGVRKVLEEALKIGQEMGLETYNANNYIGWAEVKGTSGKMLATITHLDVVPAGNGWDADPFVMRRKGDWILGRGVSDDKGPSVLCLYIAKFLKEQKIDLKYDFRVLLGCNEETGMKDVDYYLEHYTAPDFCFSPDAEFPVCNGEKGLYSADLISNPLKGNIVDFHGGVASNAVPDAASCVIKAQIANLPTKEGIVLTPLEDGLVRIDGKGKAGHAAFPTGTVNAIGVIVEYVLENTLCTPEETEYLQFLSKLFASTDGSGLGIASDDGLFDPLTIIGGTIRMEDGRLIQNVNSRYPTSITAKEITKTLQKVAGQAAQIQAERENEPFYISADHPAIQTLLGVYNEVTGENAKPFTMGGGTYARHFPFAVSFGPEVAMGQMPQDVPDFVGNVHGPNEGANIQHLLKALKIYLLSVLALQELDL